jgi:hypothetical protein
VNTIEELILDASMQGNNLQATIFRNGFLDIVNYMFGDNQNEFIADEVFKGRPQDYHNHWVFQRDNFK